VRDLLIFAFAVTLSFANLPYFGGVRNLLFASAVTLSFRTRRILAV
jgi:hypothetical protein